MGSRSQVCSAIGKGHGNEDCYCTGPLWVPWFSVSGVRGLTAAQPCLFSALPGIEPGPGGTGPPAKDMGLDKARGVETPASKETGKNERNLDRFLKDKDAKWFRQMARTALYLSVDRPTIQFAVSQIATGMLQPTELHLLHVRRLVRYLVKHRTEQ